MCQTAHIDGRSFFDSYGFVERRCRDHYSIASKRLGLDVRRSVRTRRIGDEQLLVKRLGEFSQFRTLRIADADEAADFGIFTDVLCEALQPHARLKVTIGHARQCLGIDLGHDVGGIGCGVGCGLKFASPLLMCGGFLSRSRFTRPYLLLRSLRGLP